MRNDEMEYHERLLNNCSDKKKAAINLSKNAGRRKD